MKLRVMLSAGSSSSYTVKILQIFPPNAAMCRIWNGSVRHTRFTRNCLTVSTTIGQRSKAFSEPVGCFALWHP